MQLRFVRSGGFAGAATKVEGCVNLKADEPSVTSPSCQYQRALSSHEAETLRSCLATAQPGAKPEAPVRDGYQYDISLETEDGKQQELTLGDTPQAARGVSPRLVHWVQNEAERIWSHRIANRKNM